MNKNKDFEEWKARLNPQLKIKALIFSHNDFVYYWNNNFSVEDVILFLEASDLSTKGREVFQNAKKCGCYWCMIFFIPEKIVWDGNLPLCPYCRTDSVLPELKNYLLSEGLLNKLNDISFRKRIIEMPFPFFLLSLFFLDNFVIPFI